MLAAPAPWLRAGMIACTSAVLGGTAHALAGGSVAPSVVAGCALAFVPAIVPFSRRELGGAQLLLLVTAVQVVVHLVLQAALLAPGADLRTTFCGTAAARVAAPGAPMAAGGPMASGGSMAAGMGVGMLAGHALAVLSVVAVLRLAERHVCAAVRVLAATGQQLGRLLRTVPLRLPDPAGPGGLLDPVPPAADVPTAVDRLLTATHRWRGPPVRAA